MDTPLLLFGFEAFHGAASNPSGVAVVAAARALPGCAACVLPVSFARAFPSLKTALLRWQPQVVLGVGQGQSRFAFERCARNWVGERADDEGQAPAGEIVHAAPPRLEVKLDQARLVADANAQVLAAHPTLRAEASDDAGDFVCNHTLYQLLWCETGTRSGFLHVPRSDLAPQGLTNSVVRAAARALLQGIRAAAHSA